MANNFFNYANKAYSENLNDGILVGNSFDLSFNIQLPADTDGIFPDTSDVIMAKVADVNATPNQALDIGAVIENNRGTAQDYRLTIYPNYNRYGGFKSIKLTSTGDVSFYIANKGASVPIAPGLDYDDLSNIPELKVLKEYDLVITLGPGATVSGVDFVFQSSRAAVSASISQENVDGLINRLNNIENRINNYLNVDIIPDSLLVEATTPVNFAITARNITAEPATGKTLTVYIDDEPVGTVTTDEDGEASYTASFGVGIHDFKVCAAPLVEQHVQIQSYGFVQVKTTTGRTSTLFVDEYRRIARLYMIFEGYYFEPGDAAYFQSEWVPEDYRPYGFIHSLIGSTYELIGRVWSNGDIGISNKSTGQVGPVNIYAIIEWAY